MNREETEAAARALYDACPSVKPNWDQLGDVTRSVWRERVVSTPAVADPPKPPGYMKSLF